VWENYTKGNSNVIVNVVDGGVDPSHPDLVDNLIAGGDGGSKNFVRNNYVINAEGHGTHVGGIIAAISNNGVGVAGIAGGDYANGVKGVKILCSQVFDGDASASNFAEGIRYGADNGAVISQNSWGYEYENEEQAKNSSLSSIMKTGIDYFTQYAGCDNSGNQLSNSMMKGGLVVFAAGNDGWQYGQPASYEGVMAVGSTDSNGGRSYYSNYGDWVDICAPGANIYSTYYSNGHTYASLSGTSMACPMVSGVAALVVSYCGGLGFTCEDLWNCLVEGADPNKVMAVNVGPYLDALGAVTYMGVEAPDPIDSYDVSVSANAITFTWNVPAGDDEGNPAYGMLLCASTNKSSIDNLDPRNIGSDVNSTSIATNELAIDDVASGVLYVDKFNTTYYVTCVPFNYGSKYTDKADTKTVTTGSNNPPVITPEVDVTDLQVPSAQTVRVAFEITDPDGHDVSVSYKAASIADTWASQGNGRYTLTINGHAQDSNGNYVEQKSYSSSVTATDSYGEETNLNIRFTILDNRSPYAVAEVEKVILTTSGSSREAEIDIDSCFYDPDGDRLDYTIENTSSSTVNAVINSTMTISDTDTTYTNKLYLTARKVGTAEITITAKDPAGLTAQLTTTVPVRDPDEPVMAYPNPVTDYLYISTDTVDRVDTDVKVSSSTGSVVIDDTYKASAFEPAKIDVTSLAPGTYSVRVKYGSTDVTKSIVKK
ncbi:MAG: S8 family peptidase, partial [Bacteroidales bacterium]|nr:S8 family peptidase [Bacteroidales bacterium]